MRLFNQILIRATYRRV